MTVLPIADKRLRSGIEDKPGEESLEGRASYSVAGMYPPDCLGVWTATGALNGLAKVDGAYARGRARHVRGLLRMQVAVLNLGIG